MKTNDLAWYEHAAVADLIITIAGPDVADLGVREAAIYAKKLIEEMRSVALADLKQLKKEWAEHKASCQMMIGIQDEPPNNSVVLDCDNDAWQCTEGVWHASRNITLPKTWDGLYYSYRPLTLIWSPPDAD